MSRLSRKSLNKKRCGVCDRPRVAKGETRVCEACASWADRVAA